jgi:hypothetical protein
MLASFSQNPIRIFSVGLHLPSASEPEFYLYQAHQKPGFVELTVRMGTTEPGLTHIIDGASCETERFFEAGNKRFVELTVRMGTYITEPGLTHHRRRFL